MGNHSPNLGKNVNNVYFIGIGGVHMSGLAELLAFHGYTVSGSDANRGEATERLSRSGIIVHTGHDASNVGEETDLAVYTSAVKSNNPELERVRTMGIPVMDRARLLGIIMRGYKFPVCISGTHGKTTTTSMIAEILYKNGKDPTVMNGGVCTAFGTTMRIGESEYFVVEADEYYDAFLQHKPYVGVILNIEKDHTDYFPTLGHLRESFKKFAGLTEQNGALVLNGSISNYEEISSGHDGYSIIYNGGGKQKDGWIASGITYNSSGHPSFDVFFQGKNLGRAVLAVPGIHNIENSLAAIAACSFLGLKFADIAGALKTFTGAKRRFEYKGVFEGVCVVDDYAHHPTEIKATLAAAKNTGSRKIWVAFQPHTRSRTIELLEEFSESFDNADKIVLLDIFTPSGREEGHINVNSRDLQKKLVERGKEAHYFHTFGEAAEFFRDTCAEGDMVITMGAGDIFLLGESLVKR